MLLHKPILLLYCAMFAKKIDPALQASLENLNIETATENQKKWISRLKSGGDLIAVGAENSGKTTSYIVTLIHRLKHAVADVPRAMVLCATKEDVLACQEQFEKIGQHTDLRFHVGFDGADIQKQKDVIYFGTDIVIGTPKRIGDLMSIEGINFTAIKTLIIDDGQEIMKHTALSITNRIAESLPSAQIAICTQNSSVNTTRFANKFMKSPKTIIAKN